MYDVHHARVETIREGETGKGPVIYWMSREQRAHDNWALLHAHSLAAQHKRPLGVVFCLAKGFLEATRRQYDFMLRGLEETAQELDNLSIPFTVLKGDAPSVLPGFLNELDACTLVTDFDPLRIKQEWQKQIASAVSIPIFEVDGHNVVPCRNVSDKQEYAAYTIRPKIHKKLDEFLEPFPKLVPPSHSGLVLPTPDFAALHRWVDVDESVAPVCDVIPGSAAAQERLDDFLAATLPVYEPERNNPTLEGVSRLSPYLHFGQIAPQRVALDTAEHPGNAAGKEAFLEQLIVRRELTDNFCLHNPQYDSIDGGPEWGLETLLKHEDDHREYSYSREELEQAKTHSPLWNAAQLQMVNTGYMHNYMRMYWAKKILEWTSSPEEAVKIALYLNNRYELDGRDPNGYVGVLWAITGVHDRPWRERDIYGSIRYMNSNGCRRKFKVDTYIKQYGNRPEQCSLL